jgi:hypothetical protein
MRSVSRWIICLPPPGGQKKTPRLKGVFRLAGDAAGPVSLRVERSAKVGSTVPKYPFDSCEPAGTKVGASRQPS